MNIEKNASARLALKILDFGPLSENFGHPCSNETRKFYKKLNESRKGFVIRAKKSWNKNGRILSDEGEAIERWKQHYDEHLNGLNENQYNMGDEFTGILPRIA